MKLHRQRTDRGAIYYTSNLDPNKSLWWVSLDRTVSRRRYNVHRKHQIVCRDLTIKGQFIIEYDASTLRDAIDYITSETLKAAAQ